MQRLDDTLVSKNILPNKEKASAYIMQGWVLVDEVKLMKAGTLISDKAVIRLLKEDSRYVSRGGQKLEGAYTAFSLDFTDAKVLDLGISTGGFTDFCLQHGAETVLGIDVGYGQVANKIQQDARVIIIERCNARTVSAEDIQKVLKKKKKDSDLLDKISHVVMDVSFISILNILPHIKALLPEDCIYTILVKPQFEAAKSQITEGGVITDTDLIKEILGSVQAGLEANGFVLNDSCQSPLKGAKGNQEYFFSLSTKE